MKLLVGIGEGRGHRLRHRPQGVRADRADRPPPRQRDRSTRRRSSAARSATLPLLNSAFRQAQGHRRSVRQRDLLRHRRRQPPHHDLHARRRQQRRRLGPPDDDRHRAARRDPGNDACSPTRSRPSSAGPPAPRSTSSPSPAPTTLHGEGAVPGPARRLAGEDVLDQRLLPAVGLDLRRRRPR